MSTAKRITNALASAEEIPFDDSSRFILMSDVHRGDGSWADDFSQNENVFFAALTHYYQENYTYIELGDGDELWKNKKFSDILPVHLETFLLLAEFHKVGRLYFIYGNHDTVKSRTKFVKNNLYQYFDEQFKKNIPLFENIKIHEGLVLGHRTTGQKILLIHGHQASFLDYEMWRMRRFLVRHFWKPLELLGFNDPTSTAKNYKKKDSIEQKLTEWAARENQMLIAGHTHRPMFPEVGEPLYFNDGSCVHPRSITGIEIAGGSITLVKWNVKSKSDGTLYTGRKVLAGPKALQDYFYPYTNENINEIANSPVF